MSVSHIRSIHYDNVPIPFVTVGNRRALTDLQLEQNPELNDFVNRFRDNFERDHLREIWILIELEDIQK